MHVFKDREPPCIRERSFKHVITALRILRSNLKTVIGRSGESVLKVRFIKGSTILPSEKHFEDGGFLEANEMNVQHNFTIFT